MTPFFSWYIMKSLRWVKKITSYGLSYHHRGALKALLACLQHVSAESYAYNSGDILGCSIQNTYLELFWWYIASPLSNIISTVNRKGLCGLTYGGKKQRHCLDCISHPQTIWVLLIDAQLQIISWWKKLTYSWKIYILCRFFIIKPMVAR